MKKYSPNPRVLLTPLAAGSGVLIHLDSKFYFSLNQTGLAVWKLLAAQPQTEDSLVFEIMRIFEVDENTARADLRSMLTDLDEEGLVDVL